MIDIVVAFAFKRNKLPAAFPLVYRHTPNQGDIVQFLGNGGSRIHRTAALTEKPVTFPRKEKRKKRQKQKEHSARSPHGLVSVAQTPLFEAIGLPVALSVHVEHLLSVFKALFYLNTSFIPSLVSSSRLSPSHQLMWAASLAILRRSCWCVGTRLELTSPSSVVTLP